MESIYKMKSLFNSYNMVVNTAYIIRLKENNISESMAERCASSCRKVGQNFQFWDAYDGTKEEIKFPNHHNQILDLIKITDHYATKSEVATALSHISLWAHCVLIDKPIVILEHDAIMIKKYVQHQVFNSICFLGSKEQYELGWQVMATPPHASEGPNYHFICRAHAYAIDPAVAKNLLAHAIKFGIHAPLDIMVRADIFPMHQTDLFAYDKSDAEKTTILGRPKEGRSTTRNDKLEI
jgi:GR25 family glycosyltransferase involved in LPS biosynthesis